MAPTAAAAAPAGKSAGVLAALHAAMSPDLPNNANASTAPVVLAETAAAAERAVAFQWRRMSISIMIEARQRVRSSVERLAGAVRRPSTPRPVAGERTESLRASASIADGIELDAATDVHTVAAAALLERLGTSSSMLGISDADAAARLVRDGPNAIVLPRPHPARAIMRALFHGFAGILWIAAILCVLAWKPFGEPAPDPANLTLAVVIVIVILLQAAFTLFQEHRSGQVMASLQRIVSTRATVVRGGQPHDIPGTEVVVGDIVLLASGMRVPADVRLLECHALAIDQASLTGESEPVGAAVEATDANYMQTRNMAFLGTNVVDGKGVGVVVATGNATVMGKVSLLASRTPPTSALEREIAAFVRLVCIMAFVTIVVIVVVWAAWLHTAHSSFVTVAGLITIIIGAVVALLPDGLPVAVSLTLTAVARRMFKNDVVLRNISSVETLGSVNVLASDKTGTLTTNRMAVATVVFAAGLDRDAATAVLQADCDAARLQYKQGHAALHALVHAIALCNSASTVSVDTTAAAPRDGDSSDALSRGVPTSTSTLVTPRNSLGGAATKSAVALFANAMSAAAAGAASAGSAEPATSPPAAVAGNASDIAMLAFVSTLTNVDTVRASLPTIFEVPFSSRDKYMLTVHAAVDGTPTSTAPPQSTRTAASTTRHMLLLKGAAEIVLARCTHVLLADGQSVPMVAAVRASVVATLQTMAEQGQRVLAAARTTANVRNDLAWPDVVLATLPTEPWCFLGLVGLVDPPRPEVPDAVRALHAAGIRVMMVTGDHPATAVSIARQVGILDPDDADARLDRLSSRGADPDLEPATSESPAPGGASGAARRAAVVTGAELAAVEDDDWDWILRHERIVFARTTPHHKLAIVKACQARGLRVAVTGDGVNDAPALRQADIGVAMGAGSQVAQEAAAVVLLNDRFTSILVAIQLGRLVFDNLKKVILYLLPAGSFAELIPILTTIFLGMPLALSSFLMIVICVGTDMVLSLSLIHERAEADIMHRPPRNPATDRLVDARLLLDAYLFRGVYMTVCAFALFANYITVYGGIPASSLLLAFETWTDGFYGKTTAELDELLKTGQSIYFITVVFIQFFNLLSVRTRTRSFFQHTPWGRPSRNLRVFVSIVGALALVLLIVLVPFFNRLIGTRPPPAAYWFYPLPLGVGLFALDEARKAVRRRWPKGFVARWSW